MFEVGSSQVSTPHSTAALPCRMPTTRKMENKLYFDLMPLLTHVNVLVVFKESTEWDVQNQTRCTREGNFSGFLTVFLWFSEAMPCV